ncbi:MAG: hypothetical protein HGA47_13175, partial [Zoogloea sp.]|nr:hypothetical protein [Zoogloea sp.]
MPAHAPLVVIGEATASGTAPDLDTPVLTVPDWASFVAADTAAIGFLIGMQDEAQAADVGSALRASRWWDRLACSTPGFPSSPLLDGEATLAAAMDKALRSEAKRQSLNFPMEALESEERLLAFLYLRDDALLVPVLDPAHRLLYRYPLAEAVAGSSAETHDWLVGLVRRQLLEAQELVNRVRHCTACASAHLLFVDVCPQCNSIQIARAELLHCFTCGHVAEEADFISENGMRCPNCHTGLRHIGVDYDRPLARYRCAVCHHLFVDASVVARCLHCGLQSDPDSLDVRDVSVLRLSSRGRAALRAGAIAESFAALETANYVVPAYFQHMLGWMLLIAKRHKEFSFGLVRVEFLNVPDILEAIGAMRTFMLLDEFARRLREILRASDVSTRTAEDHLLLLLPFTPPEGVVKKINDFLHHAADIQEAVLIARAGQHGQARG